MISLCRIGFLSQANLFFDIVGCVLFVVPTNILLQLRRISLCVASMSSCNFQILFSEQLVIQDVGKGIIRSVEKIPLEHRNDTSGPSKDLLRAARRIHLRTSEGAFLQRYDYQKDTESCLFGSE